MLGIKGTMVKKNKKKLSSLTAGNCGAPGVQKQKKQIDIVKKGKIIEVEENDQGQRQRKKTRGGETAPIQKQSDKKEDNRGGWNWTGNSSQTGECLPKIRQDEKGACYEERDSRKVTYPYDISVMSQDSLLPRCPSPLLN